MPTIEDLRDVLRVRADLATGPRPEPVPEHRSTRRPRGLVLVAASIVTVLLVALIVTVRSRGSVGSAPGHGAPTPATPTTQTRPALTWLYRSDAPPGFTALQESYTARVQTQLIRPEHGRGVWRLTAYAKGVAHEPPTPGEIVGIDGTATGRFHPSSHEVWWSQSPGYWIVVSSVGARNDVADDRKVELEILRWNGPTNDEPVTAPFRLRLPSPFRPVSAGARGSGWCVTYSAPDRGTVSACRVAVGDARVPPAPAARTVERPLGVGTVLVLDATAGVPSTLLGQLLRTAVVNPSLPDRSTWLPVG